MRNDFHLCERLTLEQKKLCSRTSLRYSKIRGSNMSSEVLFLAYKLSGNVYGEFKSGKRYWLYGLILSNINLKWSANIIV